MKKIYLSFFVAFISIFSIAAQEQKTDTLNSVKLSQVTVTSNRLPINLKNNPGSVTLITTDLLSLMPKSIGAEEALRFVPGVRVDNQHDGERVHLSIRGQGILTERGLRGIGVLLDGIPLNDPSGFAPDLYDVDWATVKKIEVLRGPQAGLYGSGGAAGIINITTNNGGSRIVGGTLSQTVGSNGFFKTLAQVDGSKNSTDYRISYSRTDGDGYRDHQAFWSNKLYEKLNFQLSPQAKVTQIISHTDYFQQNPEGLNLGQFDNLRQANPDACPFNEYQKTNRNTFGLHGTYSLSDVLDFEATGYLRSWNYKETSNKVAEYRNTTNPGANAQLNYHFKTGDFSHSLSAGADFKWQDINMYKLKSTNNLDRKESTDQTNLETNDLQANQIISQQSIGAFALYQLTYGSFNLIGNVRYDNLQNKLTDKLGGNNTETKKNFDQASLRFAANYNFMPELSLFVNWSQGFIPPSTEELASNPLSNAGFNTYLKPATAKCFEGGFRGFVNNKLSYEVTAFVMNTQNDFFRFKQHDRGNQEVFYGNAGNSNRKGIEISANYDILSNLTAHVAYTYADYHYTSATVDPVYLDPTYVLTIPPVSGQWLPNSPRHQLAADVVYGVCKDLKINVGVDCQSKWAIYTDAIAYAGLMDPTIYNNWQKGFTLLNAGITYDWRLLGLNGDLSLTARNLTGAKYMAFTEPDPDGNSYQPGPKTEIFGTLRIKF